MRGPDAGASAEIAGGSFRIGTSAENDLVISDGTVSRRHCELEPTPSGVRVRDAGSTNGIELAGNRVYDAIVCGDFRIGLGDTILAVAQLTEFEEREQLEVDGFGDIVGRSACMRELFAALARVAPTDHTLLIYGETGTGKDLIAEAVHARSRRAGQPLIVLDCGAIARTLVESELFGHERGAFTGAANAHEGVFEQADTGTLFLDEIGELPLELQPKLLRVLERRELRRVGGTRSFAVDVRIIAATNRNLRAEVDRGTFREDLYYRLAQAQVVSPPLRDRAGDLELLVRHFLSMVDPPTNIDEVPEAVWEMFRRHRWPGNVRELKNAVQRLAVTPGRVLPTSITRVPSAGDASAFDPGQPLPPLALARRDASDAFELAYVRRALELSAENVPRAAELAGISRQMMLRLARKHDLK